MGEGEIQGGEVAQGSLFGWDPVPVRGRGQPRHERTEERINKIMGFQALNKTQAEIANGLGISEPTLRRYYSPELKRKAMARDALEAELFLVMVQEARSGNTSAYKQVQARLDRAAMDDLAQRVAMSGRVGKDMHREVDQPARVPARGKKEKALDDAEAVMAAHPLLDPKQMN